MEKVKLIRDVFVEATGTLYRAGTEHEVSDVVAERHGEKGTGFMKVLSPPTEAKSKTGLKKS